MQVTKKHVVAVLRKAGFFEQADEAHRELPDPVDLDQALNWCAQRGISHELVVNSMGGSP
jgi:hypothetical protein